MATSTTQYHMVQVSVAAFLGQEELLSSGPLFSSNPSQRCQEEASNISFVALTQVHPQVAIKSLSYPSKLPPSPSFDRKQVSPSPFAQYVCVYVNQVQLIWKCKECLGRPQIVDSSASVAFSSSYLTFTLPPPAFVSL